MITARILRLLLIAPLLCAPLESPADELATQDYKQAALVPGVRAENIGKPIQIRSIEAIATVAAVRLIASDGKSHPGARLSFSNHGQKADLYIAAAEVTQLREEFVGFENWSAADLNCEAISICVQGVARCSPSHSGPKALCPSTYSTPQGERGVLVSTTNGSFRFPTTQASAFVAALDASIEQMTAFTEQN